MLVKMVTGGGSGSQYKCIKINTTCATSSSSPDATITVSELTKIYSIFLYFDDYQTTFCMGCKNDATSDYYMHPTGYGALSDINGNTFKFYWNSALPCTIYVSGE